MRVNILIISKATKEWDNEKAECTEVAHIKWKSIFHDAA